MHHRWHYFPTVGAASRCDTLTFRLLGGAKAPRTPPKLTLTALDRKDRQVCPGCDVTARQASTAKDAKPAKQAERQPSARTQMNDAKFVKAFLQTGNATEAYQRMRGGEGSRQAARQKGAKRLKQPRVRDAIRNQILKVETSAERVIAEIAALAHVNLADFYDKDGELVPIHKLPREVSAALIGAETILKNVDAGDGHIDRVHKIRIHSKRESLELLAKHYKLLVERVSLEADDKLLALLDAGRQRNAAGART